MSSTIRFTYLRNFLKKAVKQKTAIAIFLSLISLGIVLLLGTIFPRSFTEWEERSLDYRLRLRKAIQFYPYITTIGIDDQSLDKLGPWPWNRAIHARMITLLKRLGATSVNMDIFFPRPASEPGDSQFIQAVQEAQNVILSAPFYLIDHPCFSRQEYADFLDRFPHAKDLIEPLTQPNGANLCVDLNALTPEQIETIGEEGYVALVYHAEFVFTGEEDQERVEAVLQKFQYPFAAPTTGQLWYGNRTLAPMKQLTQAAAGFGHATATPDSDGVFRRVPLVIQVKDHLFPSLSFAAVLHYLHVKPADVMLVPGKYVLLRNVQFPESATPQDIRIPVDHRLQMRISYPSVKFLFRERMLSFNEVLKAENDPEAAARLQKEIAGRICVLGYLSTGTGDIGPNPLETNFFLAFIHSSIINTILTQQFLYDTNWWFNFGLTVFLALVLAVLSARLAPLNFTLTVLGIIGGYVALAVGLVIKYGIILKLVYPVLTVLILSYTLIIVYWYATEERERKQLRSAFKTYVSRQMLTRILDNPKSLSLHGQRKEITILFSDIKAFSTLSDRIEPELVHRLLNLYFSRMTNVAFKYDGFVDKFIGDGMLCFFGDPIFHPDHALRAVRSAIEMQRAVRTLAVEIQEDLGLRPITIRIGINTGPVIVGNMGSAERMEYTVLGSEVNLAQRLEASATPGEIMISEKTYERIKQDIQTRDMGEIRVKGFERPVKVYEVELPFE